MTKKQEKEYQDEIRSLNSVLLEVNDHANALGYERDRWKELSISLMKKLGIDFSVNDDPILIIDKV